MPRRRPSLPVASIRRRLLRWYDGAKRDLPWRAERAPYRVWISEIMLQQTRVAVVIPYYERFIRRFPTVYDLAAAPEPEVLALWSGLGYYRRARMLHQAAKRVVTDHEGQLPDSSALLLSLAGIGRYTAAAIASICFGERAAVVDGNVERVLERLRGRKLSSAEQWEQAEQLVPPSRPGDFNQAMMELGATICTPLSPKCSVCPLRALCRQQGTVAVPPKPARRKHRLLYLLDTTSNRVRLVQRKQAERLMPNMWELPAGHDAGEVAFRLRHSITTTDYAVEVRHGRARTGKYVALPQLAHLPLTGLARKILRKAELLKDGRREHETSQRSRT